MGCNPWQVARERILKELDDATSPNRMSKQTAVESLEEVAADIEGRLDALRGEIAAGED